MKTKLLIAALCTIILFAGSCKKDIETPEPIPVNPTQDLNTVNVSPDFTWRTSADIAITLTATKASGLLTAVSTKGIILQKAYLQKDKAYLMKLCVPTTQKSIRLLFMGKDITVELNASTLSYTF